MSFTGPDRCLPDWNDCAHPFLSQIIPYPPDAGPKVKTWHVLRYLSGAGHQVTLASFVRPEEQAFVQSLREVCSDVHTVPIRRSRVDDVAYWHLKIWIVRSCCETR